MDIILVPSNPQYDASDEKWSKQVNSLTKELQEVGRVELQRTKAEGKGSIADIVLALGSSGLFAAFAQIVEAWIKKDRHRSLKLKVKHNEEILEMEIEGNRISKDTFQDMVKQLEKLMR